MARLDPASIQLPLTLRPNRVECVLATIAAAFMAGVGILFIRFTNIDPWLSWGLAVPFSIAALVSIAHMFSSIYSLRLTPDGFHFRSLFQNRFVAWRDVDEFWRSNLPSGTVGWTPAAHLRWPPGERPFSQSAELLPSHYGLRGRALVRLLNTLRQRYG